MGRRPDKQMRSLAAPLLLLAGCATGNPRECYLLRGADEIYGKDLVEVVDHDSARDRLLAITLSPPGEPAEALVEWFAEEWSAIVADLPADASLYWFKESKGMLGYRQGVVAVRDCRILRSSAMADDN